MAMMMPQGFAPQGNTASFGSTARQLALPQGPNAPGYNSTQPSGGGAGPVPRFAPMTPGAPSAPPSITAPSPLFTASTNPGQGASGALASARSASSAANGGISFGWGQNPNGAQPSQQWQPPAMPAQGAQWQPQAGGGAYGGPAASPPQGGPPPPQATPQQSIEQQALGGTNAQQTQNFLSALRQAGAGSNNSFLASSGPAPGSTPAPLLGAPVASNGGMGSVQYAGGANAGMGNVSYNAGLGATGGGVAWTPLGNSTSTSGTITNPTAPPPQSGTVFNQGDTFGGSSNGHAPILTTGMGGGPGTQQSGFVAGMSAPPSSLPPGFAGGGGAPVGSTMQLDAPSGLSDYTRRLVSDERAKTAVAPAGRDLSDFLDAIGAHSYEYKNKAHGEGRFVSPMAQELAKTELGKSAIEHGADGLMRVHYGRVTGVALAGLSDVHKRLKKLEARA